MNLQNLELPYQRMVKDLAFATEFCTRVRYKNSTCSRCLDICPVDAIEFDKGLKINPKRCISCGLCAAVCPTGTFCLISRSSLQIFTDIKTENTINRDCLFKCSQTLAAEETDGVQISVECLGQIEPLHLVKAVGSKARTVRMMAAVCDECQGREGFQAAVSAIEQAKAILGGFGIGSSIIIEQGESPGDRLAQNRQKTMSRKEFLSLLASPSTWSDNGFFHRSDQEDYIHLESELVKGKQPTYIPVERKLLLSLMERMSTRPQPVIDWCKTGEFGEISLNENCNGCGMCAFFCPTGALSKEEMDNRVELNFQTALCVNCGLCREVCPRGAVEFSRKIDLNKILGDHCEVFVSKKEALFKDNLRKS